MNLILLEPNDYIEIDENNFCAYLRSKEAVIASSAFVVVVSEAKLKAVDFNKYSVSFEGVPGLEKKEVVFLSGNHTDDRIVLFYANAGENVSRTIFNPGERLAKIIFTQRTLVRSAPKTASFQDQPVVRAKSPRKSKSRPA